MAQSDGPTELDRVLSALVELLASVNVATLEDPSHYRVANTCALAALVARDVIIRYGLEQALADAVQARIATPSLPTCPCDCHLAWDRFSGSGGLPCPSCGHTPRDDVEYADARG